MKLVFTLSAFFLCNSGWAHAPGKDSVGFYLDHLNNNGVTVTHNRFELAGMSTSAAWLYQHAAKNVVGRLTALLSDGSKTLAVHVLLTLLFEPTHNELHETSEDLTETILFLYRYNGLEWTMRYNKTNVSTELQIDATAIKKLRMYWNQKLAAALPVVND